MPNPRALIRCLVLAVLIVSVTAARADESFRYREARYGKGELKHINGLPVLVLQGTPEEIGCQQAALVAEAASDVMTYPRELLKLIGREDRWPKFLEMSRSLLPQFPDDHIEELESFVRQSGLDRDLLVGVNVMVDTYRGGFGCSSLIVEARRSATGKPLFGRNLDFFTGGMLQKYNLVVVCRPNGKHAFASVGFPGIFGCFSGINDAGLAVAVHEIFFSKDGSKMFNPQGTPYTLVFRRVLEECSTVEEAEELVRSMDRTTLLSLAMCDRNRAAVLEITPKNVVPRHAVDGICVCTNHFLTSPLATFFPSRRHNVLMQSRQLEKIGLADVAGKLDEVNLGRLTVQTMIFEPATLELHLAIGSCPSSALPLKHLELAPLLDATSVSPK